MIKLETYTQIVLFEEESMEKTLRKKLAFATADIFGGGSFNIVNFLYPGFLALTIGLDTTTAGIVMLIARIWDAVIDPFVGYLSDKTKSRFGKRRIYLMVVAPFILVSMYFLFYPYQFTNMNLNIIAVTTSYLLFTTAQSLIMIPYFSLASEISSDYQTRASYNSYRLGFSIFSSIICVAVPSIIIDAFPNNANLGYQIMSLSFGTIFMLSILITGLFAKEEIITPPSQEKLDLASLAKPLKIKTFRQYLGMYLMVQIAMAIMSAVFFFYVDFYFTKTATLNGVKPPIRLIAAALMFGMQIVALPFYLRMIEKKGKMFVYRFGSLIWIISAIALFFIPADGNPLHIYLLAAIMGFGISAPGLIPHAMYGDVVDVGELYLKERLDGQMSGFANFINQISQGGGVAFAMFIIGIAGFQEQIIGEPIIREQSDGAMLVIRLIMALTPILFLGFGSLISYRYRIDAKKQAEVKQALVDENLRETVIQSLEV